MASKKLYYWLAQLFGWGSLYGLGVIIRIFTDSVREAEIMQATFSISTGILVTHLIRFVIIKRNWFRLSIGKLIFYSLGLTLLGAIVHKYFHDLLIVVYNFIKTSIGLDPMIIVKEDDFSEFAYFVLIILSTWIVYIIWMIIYYAFHFGYKSRQESIRNLQLEALQTEIELNNLKSQLNPHFMFNSLNSIRALVDIEPSSAKQSITQLSNILRSSLQMGKKNTVPISDEMELVENYLKMEKIRFEERLDYSFDIEKRLFSFEIPPLVIQTLVENSIKHGISSLIAGGSIEIKIWSDEKTVFIAVRNDGKLKEKQQGTTGIGLDNTQRRLDLVYGKNAKFDLKFVENKVVAQIKINRI